MFKYWNQIQKEWLELFNGINGRKSFNQFWFQITCLFD